MEIPDSWKELPDEKVEDFRERVFINKNQGLRLVILNKKNNPYRAIVEKVDRNKEENVVAREVLDSKYRNSVEAINTVTENLLEEYKNGISGNVVVNLQGIKVEEQGSKAKNLEKAMQKIQLNPKEHLESIEEMQ